MMGMMVKGRGSSGYRHGNGVDERGGVTVMAVEGGSVRAT